MQWKLNELLFVSRRLALEPWYGMGYVESVDEHFTNLLNRCTKFNYRKYRTNIAPELVKIYSICKWFQDLCSLHDQTQEWKYRRPLPIAWMVSCISHKKHMECSRLVILFFLVVGSVAVLLLLRPPNDIDAINFVIRSFC